MNMRSIIIVFCGLSLLLKYPSDTPVTFKQTFIMTYPALKDCLLYLKRRPVPMPMLFAARFMGDEPYEKAISKVIILDNPWVEVNFKNLAYF